MQTLTAILRAKPGHEGTVKDALLKVGAYVRAHEPDTLGFFVGIGAGGDFGSNRRALPGGCVGRFLFVVIEHAFSSGHVGGFDVGEGGAVVAQLEGTVVGGAASGDENFLELSFDLLEPVDGFLDVVEL